MSNKNSKITKDSVTPDGKHRRVKKRNSKTTNTKVKPDHKKKFIKKSKD